VYETKKKDAPKSAQVTGSHKRGNILWTLMSLLKLKSSYLVWRGFYDNDAENREKVCDEVELFAVRSMIKLQW
jgi:hypothetical protein